jgi:hypothetical protein
VAPKTLNITFAGDSSSLSKTFTQIGNESSKLGSGLLKLGSIAAKGVAVGVTAAGAAFAGLAVKGIKMNAELETSTKMFETLMGDADKAEKHVKSLFDFAAKTPFETGPIIEASKAMQTFGGEALNTEENLQMVGDAAAATGQEINEVGFWVGRAYSMIQSGKPFGEAAMRLQEMGILAPKARDEMEKLQKSGADSSEVWAVFTKEMTKFNGAMIEQSTTWSGLMSTLSDVVSMGAGQLFKPLFDSVKDLAAAFIELTNTDMWSGWLDLGTSKVEAMAGGIDKLTAKVKEFAGGGGTETFTNMFAGGAEKGSTFGADFIQGFKTSLGGAAPAGNSEWVLSLTGDGAGAGQSLASSVGSSLATALPESLRNLDYGSVIFELSQGFLKAMPMIPWGPIVETMAQTFLTTLTNLDWAGLILTGIDIFDEIVMGFITGVIEAFQRDAPAMIFGIIGILFSPAKWIDNIADAVKRIPIVGTVFAWLTRSISEIGERMKGVIGERFRSSFSWGIDFSMDAVRQLPGKARAALGNLGRVLWDAGSSLMRGLLDGIASAWRGVASYLSGLASKIRSLKGPIEKDRRLLIPEGMAIMQGFEEGLRKRFGGVERFLGDATDRLGLNPTLTGDVRAIGAPALVPAMAGVGMGGPMVVQLVLDRRVISEVVLDEKARKDAANGQRPSRYF